MKIAGWDRIANYNDLLKVVACFIVLGLICLSTVAATAQDRGSNSTAQDYQARQDDAFSIGVQAYIYGLAPVIMQRNERTFTDSLAPVNQFYHYRQLATPNDTFIPTPNADTLYSSAWLELGKGPIVLHVPDTAGRYYVVQLMDAYTNNFADVGRRTTGTGAGDFIITGPGWNGSVPAGVHEVKSPTDTVWIVGRILVDGPKDVHNVTALQDLFKLTPMSRFGAANVTSRPQTLGDFKRYSPSPDAQANLTFFEELRAAIKNNPPPKGEEALMAVFGRIGLTQNQTPYGKDIDPAMADGLTKAVKAGDQIVKSGWENISGRNINGWSFRTNIGTYGFDYLTRAVVAEGGLAANLPEEAIYLKAQADNAGQPLSGANKYVIHFAAGNMPPVDAIWSLAMYNASDYMLVVNPIDRYSIGDRTQGLKYGPDGSLDIYIQHDAPAGNGSNWLPSPGGNFYLIMRLYQPKPQVLNGTYMIPPIVKIS